jgi:hypothetical protein
MLTKIRQNRLRQHQHAAAAETTTTTVPCTGKRGRYLDRATVAHRPPTAPWAIGFCADQNVMRRRKMEVDHLPMMPNIWIP